MVPQDRDILPYGEKLIERSEMDKHDRERIIAGVIELFNEYASHSVTWDEKTVVLAETILYETGIICIGRMPWEQRVIVGRQALQLLGALAPYKGPSPLHVPSFPKTRHVLWRRILKALFTILTVREEGTEGVRDDFIRAIINPGKLSPDEEKALKDSIREELEKSGLNNIPQAVLWILKKHRETCGEVALRAFLHFLASKCSAEPLRGALR